MENRVFPGLAVKPIGRGGNRHPLSVRAFIISHLTENGEDYGANIHRAYKRRLDEISSQNGRKRRYHKPTYSSFNKQVNLLVREGAIEFSGREEESDNPMFQDMEWKPIRRYYRLK